MRGAATASPLTAWTEGPGCAQVEKRFKWIWADHGDDISMQYAGTGALKSGFTRTGRQQHLECHRHSKGTSCLHCWQANCSCVAGL